MPPGGLQPVFSSGECEIDLARRELRVLGAPVPVGGRAFEIIEVLAQSAGELVTKDELMDRIWPGAVVMENTLQVHAAAVRKALGPYRSLLKTEARRGYRLLGEWIVRRHVAATPPVGLQRMRVDGESPVTNFPATITRLIGRTAAVARLRDLISAYRVVTLTGPGGIGKTTLAMKVARCMLGEFTDGGWLVELAPLSDPSLVPSAVAGALRLELGSNNILPEAVARAIGAKKLLLVLDNCEHLIGAVATLAETLLAFCPHTTILATSREILRIRGEQVYRVSPLEVPAIEQIEVAEILGHSAPELFITRAKELGADFSSNSQHLSIIAEICRHLDGIPLAIEFAAARAATLDLEPVARGLSNRFALLTSGRRTALPRHRTLRATLDWSHELLPEAERCLLRRLAVFQGGFTLEAATAVTCDDSYLAPTVTDSMSNLVEKSLVTLSGSTPAARWRLLETIRAYALDKLDTAGERERIARRHAKYYRDLFVRAETEALERPAREWLAVYAWEIDNLRAALDWAFSSCDGDVLVGIELTAAAVPLWVYLSLTEERRRRVERALAALSAAAISDARLEMKLLAALGASLTWIGEAASEAVSVWTRTHDLAERLGNEDYQLRALWGLWLASDREAVALAQRFAAVASTTADRLIGDQMIGFSLHWQGDQSRARRHLERVIANKDAAADRINRFHVDQQPLGILARTLWLQGFPEQAMAMAERLVEHAKTDDHANSLCHALGVAACPIALWVGNLSLAEQYIDLLRETLNRHGLTVWNAVCRGHRGVLLIKRGDLQAGLPGLRAAFEECRAMPAGYRFMFIAEPTEVLGDRRVSGALVTMEEAMDRAERTAERWVIAELLRIKGELLRVDGAPEAADSAEGCFLKALQLARMQGALSWELRAATSLATLHRAQGRSDDAIACLQPVYDRFTEGFDTADLIAAKQLLDELSDANRC
jgi:predicted ATPase/DNA-binding winged helix-turn-helix (wHTH) protein